MQPLSPQSPLPAPNRAALQHSRAVKELIKAEIAAAGGWISFEHYMRLALYAPGMGYYSGAAAKFGQEGDFVTAPEISALYGRALARQAAQVLELVTPKTIVYQENRAPLQHPAQAQHEVPRGETYFADVAATPTAIVAAGAFHLRTSQRVQVASRFEQLPLH